MNLLAEAFVAECETGTTQRLLSHKIRLHPTEEQRTLLLRTFGCRRPLHDLALERRGT